MIVLVLIFFVAGVDAATIVRRLQEAALLTALPFTFIILAMCWALWRALRSEIAEEQPSHPSARASFPSTVAGDAGSLP